MHQRRGVPAAAAAGCWYGHPGAESLARSSLARSRAAGMGLQPKARSSLARSSGCSRRRGVGLLVWGCSRRRGVVGAEFVGAESLARSSGCSRRRGVGLLVWPSRRGVRWRGVPAAAAAAAGISLIGLLVWGCSRRRGVRWRGVVGAEFRLQPRRLLVWGCSRRRGVRWRGVPAAAAAGCWYIINWAAGMGLQPKARSSLARSRWRGVPAAAAAAAGMGLQPKARSSLARSRWRGVVGAEFVGAEFRLQQPPAAGISLIGLLVWGCSRRRGVGLLVWGCSRRRGVVGAEFRRALPHRWGNDWRGVVGAESLARSSLARSSLARSSGCSSRRLLVYH